MINKDTDNKLPIYKLTSKDKVLKYYDDWTKNAQFNQDMIDWKYTAPVNTVQLLDKYIQDKNIKILDAGCGSGLTGIELKKRGYANIHGVDFSKSMLNLIPNNIYQTVELIDLNKPLKYNDNNFDVIICVGTFTYGHVKPHALDELIRITRSKGLICFTINEGIYEEYGFDDKIKELSNNKYWNVKEFFKSNYITSKDVNAWLCIAEILK